MSPVNNIDSISIFACDHSPTDSDGGCPKCLHGKPPWGRHQKATKAIVIIVALMVVLFAMLMMLLPFLPLILG